MVLYRKQPLRKIKICIMKDVAIIVFTHTNYSDVWPLFFGQAEKYLKGFKKYLFTNAVTDAIPEDYITILYNEGDKYQHRFRSCLRQVPEDIVILHHEDMPLYAEPDYSTLHQYVGIVRHTDITSIKLLMGGEIHGTRSTQHPNLYEIPLTSEWLFSIQPTIWKKESLLDIYNITPGNTIWEFELWAQGVSKVRKQKNLYHYDNEPQRGMYHWDSNVYPYIATAVSKGMWVLSEYPEELGALLKEYNINPAIRGGC